MSRPSEYDNIMHALKHGCSWHGLILSPGCCECGMIRFYQENPDEVTIRKPVGVES